MCSPCFKYTLYYIISGMVEWKELPISNNLNDVYLLQVHNYNSYSVENVEDIPKYLEQKEDDEYTKKAMTVAHVPKASDIYKFHVFYLKVSTHVQYNFFTSKVIF